MNLQGVILALVIAAGALSAEAAPTAAFVAHRATSSPASVPAPVMIHFDATATVSSIPADLPFRDLLLEWDFGDPLSGNHPTTGLSRNVAYGIVAAHVYTVAGTYTVKLKATDRLGAVHERTQQVFIRDADVAWPAAVTACVSSTGVFDQCPSGAAQITQTDGRAALMSLVQGGPRRRVLFRRGDSFTMTDCWATPPGITEGLVGTYGTGARPIFTVSNGCGGFVLSGQGPSSREDAATQGWRFVGLDVRGFSNTASFASAFQTSFLVDNMLIMDTVSGPNGHGSVISVDYSGLSRAHGYMALIDNEMKGNHPTANAGSCLFGGGEPLVMMGNRCTGSVGFWPYRTGYVAKGVLEHNTVEAHSHGGNFELWKLHCSKGGDGNFAVCPYLVFSDNRMTVFDRVDVTHGGRDFGSIQFSLFERNMLFNGPFQIQNPNNVFRYNIACFTVYDRADHDPIQPRNNQFYGNACRTGFAAIQVGAGNGNVTRVDGLMARNNILLPTAAGVPFYRVDSAAIPGPVTVVNNPTADATTFVVPNPSALQAADWALAAGHPFRTARIAGDPPAVDLLRQMALGTAGSAIGAVGVAGAGAPPPDTTPPAPATVTAVVVVP